VSGHTVVIGGGIVGLSAACYLARRGQRVTVVERNGLDDSASTGNAGMVAIGHGPLPKPGLALKSLRWMLDGSSPLYIPPRADPALLAWLWRFQRACRRSWYERSINVLTEHGRHAGACFRELIETESIDCEYSTGGLMDVFRTAEGMRDGEAEAAMLTRFGYKAELLDGPALRRREPAFRSDVIGAVLFGDRAFASPPALMHGLAACVRRHGVDLRTDTEVETLNVHDGRCTGVDLAGGERLTADTVLLAAGAWSTKLARGIGVSIPMQPGKGYHVEITPPEPNLSTACVLGEAFVAATPINGALRLAGTLEFSGINDRLVQRRLDMLRTGAAKYVDGIENAEIHATWCGLRPCTADGLPVVGWAPRVRNVFIATGHAMMGFALGPLAGRIASECIVGDGPSVDIGRLAPDRFA